MGTMSYLNLLNYATSLKVDTIIAKCSHFKIGKTGETLADRRNQPDYVDTYPHIEQVFSDSSQQRVSDMESYLIDKYKSNEKCDNVKDGTDSNNYYVYVVWE